MNYIFSNQKFLKLLIYSLASFNLLFFLVLKGTRPSDSLRVNFFDVGQGDGIFIETPSRKQILIDGGPTSRILNNLGHAMPFFDRFIDVVILTHPDKDHVAGLIDVLRRYRVGLIIETGISCNTAVCEEFRKTEKESMQNGAGLIFGKLGQKLDFGDGVQLTIIHPFNAVNGETFSKPNQSGIVARLNFAGRSMLFTADIDETVEEKFILSKIKIDSDILKVAHHGSRFSTSENFLANVNPKLAFVSVGRENRYGHPTQEVLKRIADRSIKLYRTDKVGNIILNIAKDSTLWVTHH